LKKNAGQRFFSLGTSLIKAGGHLVKSEVDKKKRDWLSKVEGKLEDAAILGKKLDAVREIVMVMGELKGAVMKLGQILSSSGDLILPPEISALFRELQKNAPPMAWSEIEQELERSLGKKVSQVFKSIDQTAMASASIGQVHRAQLLSGEEVAVKIQYPDVVSAIKSDFKNLTVLKKILLKILPYNVDVDPIIEHLKESILLECDYLREAHNVELFQKTYGEKYPYMIFPKVMTGASSSTVLTMELKRGESIEATLNFDQSKKNKFGQRLYEFHLDSCYTTGLLHGDPQNGNYLFSGEQIILLDFGNVSLLSLEFRKNYIAFLRAIEKADLAQYQECGMKLGIVSSEDSKEFIRKHFELAESFYSPFDTPGIFPPPLDNPLQMVTQFMKGIKLKGNRRPSAELAVIDRTHLGLYTKLRSWKACLDWQSPKDRIFEEFERNLIKT